MKGKINMFCTKCGNQIPDDSKFCTFCGFDLTEKNEDETPEHIPYEPQASVQPQTTPQKKMSKVHIILGIIAVAVIVVLVLVIGNITETKEMKTALKNNDAAAIYNTYQMAIGDEKLIGKYSELISEKIAEISADINEYDCSETAATEGSSAFNEYLYTTYGDLFDGDYYTLEDSIYTTNEAEYLALEKLIESKFNYYDGIYYSSNAEDVYDYEEAIENFSAVQEDDSNYETALEKISECSQSYMDLTLKNVDEYIANDDISGAIDLLNSAKNYFDSVGLDSTEIQSKIDSTLATYAQKYADKAEAAFKDKDINTAIGNIEVAIELQPENADYKAKKDEYELYLPFELYLEDNMIDRTAGEGGLSYEENVIGNDNKKYNNVLVIDSYVSKDFWNNSASDLAYTCEYMLGGKYNNVSGKIFLSKENYHQEYITYFEAYGDGELLYTSPSLVAGDLAEAINFDVTNVQRLEIRYYAEISQYNYVSADIYISDLIAQKAFPESEE